MAAVDASNRNGLTVAVVGAECSGKTTLAMQLGQHFGVPCVPEFSRVYLEARGSYTAEDVLAVARGQYASEIVTTNDHALVIADTDLVVIKVWWNVRYGGSNPWVDSTLARQLTSERRRCYLLPTPDIPWTPDPLREHPNERPALHARYRSLLDSLGVRYLEVSGSPSERLERATSAINHWLSR